MVFRLYQLRDGIERQIRQSPGDDDIDVLNWMSRTALELVGQGGLGYSFDPLVENMKNNFGDALKRVPYVLSLSRILFSFFPYQC